jgi:hypothetical protein
LVECVEGKPYSRATEPDMVIRCKGGERGRGSEHMSLMKPVKKTPEARMWTSLWKRRMTC